MVTYYLLQLWPRKDHILIAIKLLPKEICKEIILNIVTSKFDYISN